MKIKLGGTAAVNGGKFEVKDSIVPQELWIVAYHATASLSASDFQLKVEIEGEGGTVLDMRLDRLAALVAAQNASAVAMTSGSIAIAIPLADGFWELGDRSITYTLTNNDDTNVATVNMYKYSMFGGSGLVKKYREFIFDRDTERTFTHFDHMVVDTNWDYCTLYHNQVIEGRRKSTEKLTPQEASILMMKNDSVGIGTTANNIGTGVVKSTGGVNFNADQIVFDNSSNLYKKLYFERNESNTVRGGIVQTIEV